MIITLLSLFALGAPSFAAERPTLTLDQAVEEAKAHSPAFLRAKAAASEASWRQLEALSGNLPRLSVSANHYFDERYQYLSIPFGAANVTFPTIYPKTTVSLDASWTVFDGLATPLAFNAARLNHSASELELERAQLQLESDVRLRFYQALGAQLLATVAEQNVKTLKEHLERSRDLLNRGKATRFDTLRVQVQLEEAEPEKQAADDEVVVARARLSTAMGVEADERPLAGALPVPTVPAEATQPRADAPGRADIHALLERSRAADNAASSTLAQWLPKLTLAGNRTFYNNANSDLTFGNDQYSHVAYFVGVFLTWNIFDGGATLARSREAVYAREQAEQAARAALVRAPQEVESWRRRVLYSSALYRARTRAIEAAEESVRLARISYAAGTRTSTDVLDAELDLFRARAGLVRAQLESIEATANLELALGHKLQ